MPKQSRSWFGTLNNYTEEELAQVRAFECLYKAIGFHVGEVSHLPHIHVVVQFKTPRGWPKLSPRFHWESRRGSVSEALEYLNKNGRLEEFGERPADKKGIDETWKEFVESIHAGTVDKDSRMYARYEGYAKRRMAEVKPKRNYDGDLKAKNLWIWGPPRTGKSRLVHEYFAPDQIYTKYLNKWWDSYNGEKCVLVEDADPTQCKFLAHHMKVWADRYSFAAEVKNGRIQLNPGDFHFIVTSNYNLADCFEGTDYEAILERFDVLRFT